LFVDKVEAWTLPGGGPSVVVDVVYTAAWIMTTFPPNNSDPHH